MSVRAILLTGFTLALFAILSTFAVFHFSNKAHDALYQSQQARYASYLLADELRQSSDDLTRMARTYVITQDNQYEKNYWDILAIRNGELARPQNMNQIYWDLVLEYGDKPRPDTDAISLHDLMMDAGFKLGEFAMLKEAQDYSDALVKTETIAMNAVKGLYDDGNGNFSVKNSPDIQWAMSMMHDKKYHQDKAKIMTPLNRFFIHLDERTAQEVKANKEKVTFYEQLLTICLSFAATLIVIASIIIYKGISLLSAKGVIASTR